MFFVLWVGMDLRSSFTSQPFIVLSHRSKQLIKDALMSNEFTKEIAATQLREVIDCMYEKKCSKNCYIIKEGERGEHLYVCAGMRFF